jgi:uncharacterized protein (TIGR00730 family)
MSISTDRTAVESPNIQSVCVYCASSNKIHKKFFDAANELGASLALNKVSIRYGGGNTGLMGAIAKSCLENGGKVIGVIPRFMWDNKWGHEHLSEMIITETMHERKTTMLKDVDAVIALPGGVGTLEELLEIICWKKLGLFLKPIIIINTDGYYDSLIQMLENSVKENFMSEAHLKMWTVVRDVTDNQVIKAILNSETWSEDNVGKVTELL